MQWLGNERVRISPSKLSFLPRLKLHISNAMSVSSSKRNAIISDVMTLPETCIRQGSPKASGLVYDALNEDPTGFRPPSLLPEGLYFSIPWGDAP